MNIFNYPRGLHLWLLEQKEKQTEAFEQIKFCEWLEEKGLKFTSSASSTWTPSIKQKMKNKALGLRSGFPDLCIYINKHQKFDGKACLVFIEMKRKKQKKTPEGKPSDEQLAWIACLDRVPDVGAYVAVGCDEAKEIIKQFIK